MQTLILGDDALEQTIQWQLVCACDPNVIVDSGPLQGTFNIRFKASAPATKKIDHFEPLPEIQVMMRLHLRLFLFISSTRSACLTSARL